MRSRDLSYLPVMRSVEPRSPAAVADYGHVSVQNRFALSAFVHWNVSRVEMIMVIGAVVSARGANSFDPGRRGRRVRGVRQRELKRCCEANCQVASVLLRFGCGLTYARAALSGAAGFHDLWTRRPRCTPRSRPRPRPRPRAVSAHERRSATGPVRRRSKRRPRRSSTPRSGKRSRLSLHIKIVRGQSGASVDPGRGSSLTALPLGAWADENFDRQVEP
jgi:hypothetical protein